MLRIGRLELDLPVMQAAMAGYSDLAMRQIARLHGAPYALAEVVLDKLVVQKGATRRRVLAVAEDDHPVGGQLLGAEPGQLAQAADHLVAAGYDVVDLNFACPVRKVLGRRRGGYLLSTPGVAVEIVRRVTEAVAGRVPVTVKMRRGMDDTPDSERNFFGILDGALAAGVSAVTVHARTVEQRYVGPSRWGFLARVKRHVGDRVILGSGDLFAAEDVLRMMETTGVEGVTLARGCVGNPWLFQEVRALLAGRPLPDPPSVAEQGETICRHFQFSCQTHGPKLAGRIMRKFGIKYSELHPMAGQVREAFARSRHVGDWQAVLEQWYNPQRAWPAVVRPESPGHLIAAGACL